MTASLNKYIDYGQVKYKMLFLQYHIVFLESGASTYEYCLSFSG